MKYALFLELNDPTKDFVIKEDDGVCRLIYDCLQDDYVLLHPLIFNSTLVKSQIYSVLSTLTEREQKIIERLYCLEESTTDTEFGFIIDEDELIIIDDYLEDIKDKRCMSDLSWKERIEKVAEEFGVSSSRVLSIYSKGVSRKIMNLFVMLCQKEKA